VIIILGGVSGSGKDTVGDLLRDRAGFRKEAFANPLKEMVKHAFPDFTEDDLYGSSSNRNRQYPQYQKSADCVKCGLRHLFRNPNGEPGKELRCPRCESTYPEYINPRIALQTLGTEWGRRLRNDLWVEAAFYRIGKSTAPDWVITDCRFENEVEAGKRLGAFVVKLTRKLADSTDLHPSEAEFRSIPDTQFNFILDNANLSLEALPAAVEGLLMAARGWAQ